MPEKKMPIRNLAGCMINEFEQKLYDHLVPYDWDDIYLSFKEEMIMFQNAVHLLKNTPEEGPLSFAALLKIMGKENPEEMQNYSRK